MPVHEALEGAAVLVGGHADHGEAARQHPPVQPLDLGHPRLAQVAVGEEHHQQDRPAAERRQPGLVCGAQRQKLQIGRLLAHLHLRGLRGAEPPEAHHHDQTDGRRRQGASRSFARHAKIVSRRAGIAARDRIL